MGYDDRAIQAGCKISQIEASASALHNRLIELSQRCYDFEGALRPVLAEEPDSDPMPVPPTKTEAIFTVLGSLESASQSVERLTHFIAYLRERLQC